jgi:hypothetical protein
MIADIPNSWVTHGDLNLMFRNFRKVFTHREGGWERWEQPPTFVVNQQGSRWLPWVLTSQGPRGCSLPPPTAVGTASSHQIRASSDFRAPQMLGRRCEAVGDLSRGRRGGGAVGGDPIWDIGVGEVGRARWWSRAGLDWYGVGGDGIIVVNAYA